MRKWVCKKCGLYKQINPHEIKPGCQVFFIKVNRNRKVSGIEKGKVLSRNGHSLIILSNRILYTVKDTDVYPEDAPVSFVYNMFGVCDC
ncbi:hypothetical protein [Acinetobacter courvalinii]|uniref:hypothetical protein n=1 Tax=Acinetobacter courvalinii TaxID=280147 RepID=UPI003F5485D0